MSESYGDTFGDYVLAGLLGVFLIPVVIVAIPFYLLGRFVMAPLFDRVLDKK